MIAKLLTSLFSTIAGICLLGGLVVLRRKEGLIL